MIVGVQKTGNNKRHKCSKDHLVIELGEKYLLTGDHRSGTLCAFHGKRYIISIIEECIDIYNELSDDKISIKITKKGSVK